MDLELGVQLARCLLVEPVVRAISTAVAVEAVATSVAVVVVLTPTAQVMMLVPVVADLHTLIRSTHRTSPTLSE
jgi:hypothetical protein